MTDGFPDQMFARARELQAEGLGFIHANGIAWLEERIRQWPSGWGDDLQILLYGDFNAPSSIIDFPTLGITINPERRSNTLIRGALTVLGASVKVREKSVAALIDAAKRINLILGVLTLTEWGNASCGWWSWVTHGSTAGAMAKFDGVQDSMFASIFQYSIEVREKIEAAMFWIREPKPLMLESYRPSILRVYSAYWNAFECLVEAVNIVQPLPTLSRLEKQNKIDEFFRERRGKLTAENIQDCYRNVIDTGLRGKAAHALTICFGSEGQRYFEECFQLPKRSDRLYDIRNAINHGSIDAENLTELLRVEDRLRRLWMIVWRMFGRFVPFSAPADRPQTVPNR